MSAQHGYKLVNEFQRIMGMEGLNIKRITVEAPIPGVVEMRVVVYPSREQLAEIARVVKDADPDVVIDDAGKMMKTLHRMGAVTDKELVIDQLHRAGITVADIDRVIAERERTGV